MAKLELHQGSYQARSPVANAQVMINCYSENNPPDAPFPVTVYPAPGLTLMTDFTSLGWEGWRVRGLYECSNGEVVAVINNTVLNYVATPDPNASIIMGTLAGSNLNPVSICDNGGTGNDLVITDDLGAGYHAPLNDMGAGSLQQISDPAFYGSNRVDFIDTFLIFNQPGTQNMYTTTSGVLLPFDPTYYASKEGWNDNLVCCACLHDNIWLLGNTTTEIWFNAGGATFPFARMPNSILQQGCVGGNNPIIVDNALYWISQDRYGRNMCMRGEGYAARRVSTFAVEDEWSTYSNLYDAIGMAYQIGGHETVCFYFPSGNAFWCYDATTQMWHKRTYGDLSTPWLPYCMSGWGSIANVGYPNAVLAGDRTGPRIFKVDRDAYTDAGTPIIRQRSWPHVQQDGQRIAYTRFALSMQGNTMTPDTINLDWSDDAGQTYGAPVPQTVNGATNGQYLWRRLGYGRDRVYRATWSGQGEFGLNGAYSDGIPHAT